jgi:hypothetical protein
LTVLAVDCNTASRTISDFDDLFYWGLKPAAQVSIEASGRVSQAFGGVVALLLSNVDVLYCRSGIGKARRIRILSGCAVASHREHKCWVAKRQRSNISDSVEFQAHDVRYQAAMDMMKRYSDAKVGEQRKRALFFYFVSMTSEHRT